MVAVLSFMVFAGAFGVAASVIVGMVAPQWQRILQLASGQPEVAFAPLAQLAVAEQRIAVSRWSAERRPACDLTRLRVAA